MKSKKALLICSHMVNEKRKGGFHGFLDFLINDGYDVDWLTLPVHLAWFFRHNDRDNFHNFFRLWKGININDRKTKIYNFTIPFIFPGKLEKILHLSKYALKVPNWERTRKRLSNEYDVIIVESIAAPLADDIRRDYPNAKFIYRPSDVLTSLVDDDNADDLERHIIDVSDITLCVDEYGYKYYKSIGANIAKIQILRNPLATKVDIEFLRNYIPVNTNRRKSVVYVGVSFYYKELVEYAAAKIPESDFYIIGPFSEKSHDNIFYLGSLYKKDFENYLANADVGIAPIKQANKKILYGYTGKVISYMKFLLPIVATQGNNYLDIDGYYNVENNGKDFTNKINDWSKN